MVNLGVCVHVCAKEGVPQKLAIPEDNKFYCYVPSADKIVVL
jgi:hypothetical protein